MVFWSFFALEQSFFVAVLLIVHRTLGKFACGQILVSTTLFHFRQLGLVIVAWGIFETFEANVMSYALMLTHDLQAWRPDYSVDVAPLAVGLFMVAFKYVLDLAIALQHESDLTV
jgi:hypothetical protein